jgi:hypothetical protein
MGLVEEVPRIERAVPQKFKRRTMESIRSGLAYRVYDGAIAAKLRAVGVRQGLKLGDGIDSERSSQ